MLVHSERIIYIYAFINLACTGLALDTLRIYSGPFSESTCWWYKFFKNFTSAGVQFGFNSTIVFRVNNSWQITQLLSRSAHQTPNFTNPEYFVCLLFEFFFQIKQYQNTVKNANITCHFKKKENRFATPLIGEIEIWDS